MAYIQKDRVKETTTTTGTGAVTLAGAVAGFQAFSAVMSVADTCYYVIVSATGTDWETGTGTYSSASVLTRTTVLSSSNSGNAVSFAAGTKDVFMGPIANQVNDIAHGGTGATTAADARTNLGVSTGTVTSVSGAGTVSGLTLTGTVTSSGSLTLGGTLSAIPLATGVSGTLPVANGGTGVTTSTGTTNVVLSNSPTLVTPALGTPASGILSSCTVDGTDAVGFRNIPISSNSAAYTAVLADSGKVIFHPSTDANARTFTIPANASVAYALGTAITFINMTSQVVTIAITTDTMYLSSAGTTGSRSLAQYGSATAIKMTSTTWLISGSGLT